MSSALRIAGVGMLLVGCTVGAASAQADARGVELTSGVTVRLTDAPTQHFRITVSEDAGGLNVDAWGPADGQGTMRVRHSRLPVGGCDKQTPDRDLLCHIAPADPGEWLITINGASSQWELRATADLPYAEDLTVLRSGVPLANQSSVAGHPKYYRIRVPWGTTRLDVEVTGGSGSPRVYVARALKPTLTSHACGPQISGDPRQCSIARPTTLGHTPGQGDDWYVMLDTGTSFSDVTITATTIGGASAAATTMKSCREWDSVLVNGAGWEVAGLPPGETWQWTWGGGGLRVQHQAGTGEPARAARRYSLVTDPAARSGCSLRIGQSDRDRIHIHGYAEGRLTIENAGRVLELVRRP